MSDKADHRRLQPLLSMQCIAHITDPHQFPKSSVLLRLAGIDLGWKQPLVLLSGSLHTCGAFVVDGCMSFVERPLIEAVAEEWHELGSRPAVVGFGPDGDRKHQPDGHAPSAVMGSFCRVRVYSKCTRLGRLDMIRRAAVHPRAPVRLHIRPWLVRLTEALSSHLVHLGDESSTCEPTKQYSHHAAALGYALLCAQSELADHENATARD